MGMRHVCLRDPARHFLSFTNITRYVLTEHDISVSVRKRGVSKHFSRHPYAILKVELKEAREGEDLILQFQGKF